MTSYIATMAETLPLDPTLDEIRVALIADVAANAAFDGWGEAAVRMAAEAEGIDVDLARLAFTGGAVEMIDTWFAHIDAEMASRLPPEQLGAMKIRERITALVEARLDIIAPDRESLRRALTILAMPQNLPRAAKLGWRAADAMWRLAGDTATDFNHYSKRMTLSAVYGSTMAVFLDDESEDHADTRAFLARRIDGVMRFEKWKAGLKGRGDHRPSLSRFIGRLRYPTN
jgi:ubiquinone biosynthesis protein COQ9